MTWSRSTARNARCAKRSPEVTTSAASPRVAGLPCRDDGDKAAAETWGRSCATGHLAVGRNEIDVIRAFGVHATAEQWQEYSSGRRGACTRSRRDPSGQPARSAADRVDRAFRLHAAGTVRDRQDQADPDRSTSDSPAHGRGQNGCETCKPPWRRSWRVCGTTSVVDKPPCKTRMTASWPTCSAAGRIASCRACPAARSRPTSSSSWARLPGSTGCTPRSLAASASTCLAPAS